MAIHLHSVTTSSALRHCLCAVGSVYRRSARRLQEVTFCCDVAVRRSRPLPGGPQIPFHSGSAFLVNVRALGHAGVCLLCDYPDAASRQIDLSGWATDVYSWLGIVNNLHLVPPKQGYRYEYLWVVRGNSWVLCNVCACSKSPQIGYSKRLRKAC